MIGLKIKRLIILPVGYHSRKIRIDILSHTFKNLRVWKSAHELVLGIYKVTKKFPTSEKYGLTAQVRRSAVSIATNIVEGYKRRSDKDFAHFLNISDSSLEETKYHLLLSHDLKYLKENEYNHLSMEADRIGKMLSRFQERLKAYSLQPIACLRCL